jgi:predicted dehydrogenase
MTNYSTIGWGILGAGSIANRLAEGVLALPDDKLMAVGSRSIDKADAFADKYGIPNRHASYDALVNDKDVDVIYVATPHNFHREHSILALNAGKHVMCEKPFAINLREAQAIVDLARAKKLFVMEAMWTRFFPLMGRVRKVLKSGEIGTPYLLHADFGFKGSFNPEGRLYNPNLGGGALLDVGVYPISFASMVFGEPERVKGLATMGETGVDEVSGMVFGYASGALALLSTSTRVNTAQTAIIMGTEGKITIHMPWWKPDTMTVSRSGKEDEMINLPYSSSGFNYEAEEVGNCLRSGKLESDILPLSESLAIMRTMDQVRAQWGLKYPME